ncbi:YlxR family protein [Frigoribacterium salinisoli]
MEPVRTCIGTRTRAPRSALVRVVARDGRLVVDETRSLPGRGAWLTPTMEAFESAVKRRAFRRALRLDSEPDVSAVREHFTHLVATDSGARPSVGPVSSPDQTTTEMAERLMDE